MTLALLKPFTHLKHQAWYWALCVGWPLIWAKATFKNSPNVWWQAFYAQLMLILGISFLSLFTRVLFKGRNGLNAEFWHVFKGVVDVMLIIALLLSLTLFCLGVLWTLFSHKFGKADPILSHHQKELDLLKDRQRLHQVLPKAWSTASPKRL